ncbi:unnamed protein product, partial [marine sediment metagenome]
NECASFPIMYHWRVLPSGPKDPNIEYWGDEEKHSENWEHSSSIRKRVEDLKNAPAYIALFLEYVPKNLNQW